MKKRLGWNAAVVGLVAGIMLALCAGAPARAQGPAPRIVKTQFPTDDVVVADYVGTEKPYEADASGGNDATDAIQKALNDCATNGGGTVWLPAGTYKVSNTITIPEGCFLRGDWHDPNSGTGSYGTVISAAVAAGFGCLFQTQPHTDMGGIVGLTVYYPNQNASNPVDTGWVITQRGGGNKTFRNITFINAYKGIHLGNDGTGVGTVCVDLSHVYGTALSQGLWIYYGPGAGGAYHVTFNNSYWADAGKAYNAPSEKLLNAWTRANGTAFDFRTAEGYSFHHLRTSQYNIGIFMGASVGWCSWDSFAFCAITNCNTALQLDGSGNPDTFIRCTLEGSSNSIKCKPSRISLTDCTLIGPMDGSGIVTNTPGTSPKTYKDCPVVTKPKRGVLYNAVTQYNAPHVKNGSNQFPDQDATAAIQNALDAAGRDGGGVVYLPAGRYKIGTHLSIPANVELRGAGSGKTGTYTGKGTWLFVYEGENSATPEKDIACVTVNGNGAGLRCIQFFWEKNPMTGGMQRFPYAVRINNADNAYVVDCHFKNAYLGIDVSDGSDNHYLKSNYGPLGNNFIRVGASTEGWIEEMYDINPSAWQIGGHFGPKPPWVGDYRPVWEYTKQDGRTIILNGPSNEHLMGIFTFGAKYGFHISSGTADLWNVGNDVGGGCCVYAPGGAVKIMNSISTVMGPDANKGQGITEEYNSVTEKGIQGVIGSRLQTGFEKGQALPAQNDRLENSLKVEKAACRVVPGAGREGSAGLVISGEATEKRHFAYFTLFEDYIWVSESTTLTYWLRPETESARRAGIELYFAEGGNLRDSEALDLQGKRMHPTEAKGEANKWIKIECPLGRWFAGKTIRAIAVAHDDGESTGMFKAVFDDLFIGVPPDGAPPRKLDAQPDGGRH